MDVALLKRTDELAAEWAQNVTTLEEFKTMVRSLMKSTMERMFNTEMDVHLGRRTSATLTPSPARDKLFIACVNGLTGFPEAIQTAFPQTLATVHLVRAALKYVVDADSRGAAICVTFTLLRQFWTRKTNCRSLVRNGTPNIRRSQKSVNAKWHHITSMFDLSPAIRQATYTKKTIESVNSVIRKFMRNHKQ